jgi:transcriptional regulator with XRE-family HTH domain
VNSTAGTLASRPEDGLREIEERIAPLSAARLGLLLRDQRESGQFRLRDVALLPELRSELEAIEAGRVRPDAVIVEALLRCYNIDLDTLVPPRQNPGLTAGSDQEVLMKYLIAVRSWRDSEKDPMLREADFQALARILGVQPGEIQRRLRNQAIEERVAPLSTARLAALVKKLRESTRLGRDEVAQRTHAIQSKLEDVESGRLRPDAVLLESLLSSYDADLDMLVPPRRRLAVLEGSEQEVLARYLATMRRWRGRTKRPPSRDADLQVLASMLGSDRRQIQDRLRKLSGCSRRRARRLTAMLVTGMAVAPAGAIVLHSSTGASSGAVVHTSDAAATTATTTAAATTPTTAATTAAATTAAATTAAAKSTAAKSAAATTTTHTTTAVHTTAADCATALIYLAAHAKPGFAHYCRPGPLKVGITDAVAYTCVPGPHFSCPDGNAEIIIADPSCAISYENEASNSYWNFDSATVIEPGATQDGRTWDPYGECT